MSLSTEWDDEQDGVRQAPTDDYVPPRDDGKLRLLDAIAQAGSEPKLEDFVSPESLKPTAQAAPPAAEPKADSGFDPAPFPKSDTGPQASPQARGDLTPPPPPPAVAPRRDERAEHLAALNAILGNGSSDEQAIRDAGARDRQRADSRQLQAYLNAGFTRTPIKYLDQGPSDVDIEKMVQDNRAKRQSLLAGGLNEKLTGANDPALEMMRQAQAAHYASLSATEKAAEDRRLAEDAAKKDAGDKKAGDEQKKRDDETVAVQQMVDEYVKTGKAKQAGIDPEKLKGLKTVAQFNALTGSANSGFVPPPKPGRAKGASPTSARTYADAIYDGNADPNDLKGKSKQYEPGVLEIFKAEHPEYSLDRSRRFHASMRELDDEKAGSAGDVVQSSKTAIRHVNELQDEFNKLGNTGTSGLNAFKNNLAKKFGFGDTSKAYSAFQAGGNTASEELAKAYGANTEGGRHAYEMIFNPNADPKQAQAAMEMIKQQLYTRLSERDAAIRRLAQSPMELEIVDGLGLMPKTATHAVSHSTPAPPPIQPANGQTKLTPGGHPYAKRQVSPSTGAVRYLDENGTEVQ